jgi:hypothetical protein
MSDRETEPSPVARPTGAPLARFSEARGYPVFEASGCLWARGVTTKYLFDRLPLESTSPVDVAALGTALRAQRGIGALYASLGDGGTPSGIYVLPPRDHSLQRIPSESRRRQVRRGLERAELRWVEPEALLDEGLELNRQTMQRQRRFDPELGTAPRWRRFVAALKRCPGFRCAAAYADGRLAAYSIACRDGSWLHVRYRMARTDALAEKAAVALDHWMLTEAAEDRTVEVVSQGFVPVSQSGAGLDAYKRSLGYGVVAVRRALELHPFLRPFLAGGVARRAVGLAARARPADRRFDTLSALLRGAAPGVEAR